jgi:hypothetical protein
VRQPKNEPRGESQATAPKIFHFDEREKKLLLNTPKMSNKPLMPNEKKSQKNTQKLKKTHNDSVTIGPLSTSTATKKQKKVEKKAKAESSYSKVPKSRRLPPFLRKEKKLEKKPDARALLSSSSYKENESVENKPEKLTTGCFIQGSLSLDSEMINSRDDTLMPMRDRFVDFSLHASPRSVSVISPRGEKKKPDGHKMLRIVTEGEFCISDKKKRHILMESSFLFLRLVFFSKMSVVLYHNSYENNR